MSGSGLLCLINPFYYIHLFEFSKRRYWIHDSRVSRKEEANRTNFKASISSRRK